MMFNVIQLSWGVIFFIGSYLLGSVSSAILVCKIMGISDPRSSGSLNPGATNVLRIGGKLPALITLLGDIAKGFIAVILAKLIVGSSFIMLLAFAGAFIGHLYPLFFKFKGGKGVATFLGGIVALDIVLGAVFVAVWLTIATCFRYSSLAALLASFCVCITAIFFYPLEYTIFISLITVVLWVKHHQNIVSLITKKEGKIKFSR